MSDRITSAFGATTTAREITASHDLNGVSAIVTGGASGIGVETARALAEAGAEVMLAVRNKAAGEATVADIEKTAPGKVSVGLIDLSDLASVAAFASAWADKPLDILINNAGVMACPQSYTAQDLEMQVGTNHFGHYLLSVLLARALMNAAQDGKQSRLVSLSSIGHRRSGINFDDMHYRTRPYDKWESYGQAKTANSLFAVGFNERFADLGINANAVMPGGIMTPLQRHLPREEMIAFGWMDEAGKLNDRFKSTEQGASTSVWAALGDELEGVGGLYLENCNQAVPWTAENPFEGVLPHALDPETAERLWAVSEETTGARV
ncbi:MAG: SDR family NAD(P)-dependent oxidoreductase [Alphaproteobacteria bacterium]|nr:SDR family NAD(P)-dependent oxidoreductase [Alphaproteobacteria bacterium]MBU1512736.1 SDR family NAD(P)-dependent oxidoreductase [Alphaproteobacteria bacterium]MBU2096115.1 SDR family NAD(P)-dependent oxidoreductase [Alphaproteobacteria bacterium]MBU2152471.1 SDR family NAD(P)-dependent oxidoreductase [Alphaproteobacteria bacterium]MBU2307995.1 SDR family NAD(P)-dependent oxidoreductase [Alphaproteobacteria bacterium]